jgi:hypothetical protein
VEKEGVISGGYFFASFRLTVVRDRKEKKRMDGKGFRAIRKGAPAFNGKMKLWQG